MSRKKRERRRERQRKHRPSHPRMKFYGHSPVFTAIQEIAEIKRAVYDDFFIPSALLIEAPTSSAEISLRLGEFFSTLMTYGSAYMIGPCDRPLNNEPIVFGDPPSKSIPGRVKRRKQGTY